MRRASWRLVGTGRSETSALGCVPEADARPSQPSRLRRVQAGGDMSDDDYVRDADSGEWPPAAERAARRQPACRIELRAELVCKR